MSENEKAAARYCGQCGAPLEGDVSFCTQCGTPVKAYAAPCDEGADGSADGEVMDEDELLDDRSDSEPVTISFGAVKPVATAYVRRTGGFSEEKNTTTPIVQMNPTGVAAPSASVPSESEARKGPRKAIVVGAVAAVAVAIGIGIGVFAGASMESPGEDAVASSAASSASGDSAGSASGGAAVDVSAVKLGQTHVTQWADAARVTYPAFTFKYPAGWSVTSQPLSQKSEDVVLENADGVTVTFSLRVDAATSDLVAVDNVEKLADAEFKPGFVQGTSYSALGKFSVVRCDVSHAGSSDARASYALVPARALSDAAAIETSTGAPGFDYGNFISFTCEPSSPLDERTEREVVAILASLQVSDESSSSASSSASVNAEGDYLLPDSATRLYTRSELEPLDNRELYLARNEIFARHGRMFVNEDLQKHFGGKPWYRPRYAPEDFDQSMLSDVEKKNAELIQQIEKERGSSYLD